jgi:hypothetical protein
MTNSDRWNNGAAHAQVAEWSLAKIRVAVFILAT